jgi:integrase
MWRLECAPGWIFPASTKSGHINQSSIKKHHWKAIKTSGVARFVPYDLRHTCLTRWAKYLDPFTLKRLAGHESLETTMKYIHLNEADSEARLREARKKIESERQGVILLGIPAKRTTEAEQSTRLS